MRVAIRPCFAPGSSGGIEQYAKGSSRASAALEGADRFEVVGTSAQLDALASEIGGLGLVRCSCPTSARDARQQGRRVAAGALRPACRGMAQVGPRHAPVVACDGGARRLRRRALRRAGGRAHLATEPLSALGPAAPSLPRPVQLGRARAARRRVRTVLRASDLRRRRLAVRAHRRDRLVWRRPRARRGRGSWAAPAAAGRATARRRRPLRVVPRPDVGPQEPPPPHRRGRGLEGAGHARARRVHGPTERARRSHAEACGRARRRRSRRAPRPCRRRQRSRACMHPPGAWSFRRSSKGSASRCSKHSPQGCRSRARTRLPCQSSRATRPFCSTRPTSTRSPMHSDACGTTRPCATTSPLAARCAPRDYTWDHLARSCRALYRAAASGRPPLGRSTRCSTLQV